MKKATLTSLVIFTFCGLAYAGPEAFSGKDMKQVVPVPSCEISWTGFYVGLHAGYGFGQADTEVLPLPLGGITVPPPVHLDPDVDGFFGGIQAGYNRQFGAFVLGVEADLSGSTMDGDDRDFGTTYEASFHQDIDWFGTVRGRLGFTPLCRLLLYATGGLAFGDVHYSGLADTIPFQGTVIYPASFSEIQFGWTAGAGAEFAVTKRWSLKFEFLYFNLGDESFVANPIPPNPPFTTRFTSDATAYTFNGGLNFHF